MIYNTDVKTKKENWVKFAELIESQFTHGGDKYALEKQQDKEASDWVCELVPGTTDVDWIIGTMAKYLARYKNFGREKDLLKIVTYAYIIWLKKGFHLTKEHDEDSSK
jgi:hypothetical protein